MKQSPMVKLDTNYAESSGPVGMRLRLPTSEVREWLQIDAESVPILRLLRRARFGSSC